MNTRSRFRTLGAASAGNLGEIYDFAVFGFSAPILAQNFFPKTDPVAGLLGVFAVYAVAFFARPLGGLTFGYLLDRLGRVRVLALTIWIMAAATAVIGLLPTYAVIGALAPILLVLCRMMQGFALGGQTTGTQTLIVESAPIENRGLWIGIVTFCATVPNSFVALLLFSLQMGLGSADYADWGWRLPFLAGGLLGIVGFWMRWRVDEAEEFKAATAHADRASPVKDALYLGRRAMLNVALVLPVQTVTTYLLLGFFYTYLVRYVGMPATGALAANAIAIIAMAVMIPVGGAISDRYGRKPVLTGAALLIAVAAYPSMLVAGQGYFSSALLGQIPLALGAGLYTGAAFVAGVEFFPASYRATGHALAYQLTIALFGGLTPIMSGWLINVCGTPSAPGIYVAVAALIGLFLIRFVPETCPAVVGRQTIDPRCLVPASDVSGR